MPYQTCRSCNGVEYAWSICKTCDGTGVELRDERIVANESLRAALDGYDVAIDTVRRIWTQNTELLREVERLEKIVAKQRDLLEINSEWR